MNWPPSWTSLSLPNPSHASVVTEPQFEFPESYSNFPRALCFTYGNVLFPCYSLCSSHLSSPPCVYKSVLCVCPTNWFISTIFLSSVQFSHSVVSDSLRPHGLQHARPPCPSPTPRVCLNSCPSSQWCHPTILFSVIPFSFCLQSFTAWRSFSMSQFFISGGVSAST